MLWHLVMPELFVNYVQDGAGDGREARDMSGQLKCASCEPRNYKYFRRGNNAKRQSFANGFRHVRLLDGGQNRLRLRSESISLLRGVRCRRVSWADSSTARCC
jgi:hypothetical protein